MPSLLTYWHTVRYLKPVQIYGRIWFHVASPQIEIRPAPPLRRVQTQDWTSPARRRVSLVGPQQFFFLNKTQDLSQCGWDDPAIEKLWRYNLHYFDDLNANNPVDREKWHWDLLSRWVRENPPYGGTGWDPYPTSLRMVNWIKWTLGGHALPLECVESLAVQARWLARRLERHLLGNHLLANAKALIFAGAFFRGSEAEGWLSKGLSVLQAEIQEQILSDGGHFERSPMYHSLVLEDLLDLLNLARTCAGVSDPLWQGCPASWLDTINHMRTWIVAMCHPDGEIAFFNDAAIGIAPSPAELESYAVRLGLPLANAPGNGVTHLSDSGYIRLQSSDVVALLDVAPVGPDYLPGHAHADTLSFELSLFGQRVFVNSGTSLYEVGTERLRQRGTAAHNTTEINRRDSSDVWSGFRVGRRARPFGLSITKDSARVCVQCAHNGYVALHRKQIHWREWTMSDTELCVVDHITGGFEGAVSRLHLFPGLRASFSESNPREGGGRLELPSGRSLIWSIEGGVPTLESTTYHPEFGLAEPNQCLNIRLTQPRCVVRFSWR
jgi:uncharacterized heparinase superfamily protein